MVEGVLAFCSDSSRETKSELDCFVRILLGKKRFASAALMFPGFVLTHFQFAYDRIAPQND
jgi:hypothetical protein